MKKTNKQTKGTQMSIEVHASKTLAHIEAEIKAREEEIAQLNGARTVLRELFPPADEPEAEEKPARKKKGGADVPAADKPGRPPGADYIKAMAAARTAPEPFTAASLHVATGLETKFCANKLHKWKAKGFLESTGRGEFKRTKDFPAEAGTE
jgi:hypothetical protein